MRLAMVWHPELATATAKASRDHLADGSWVPGWIPKSFPNI
jgi:hypothetical protein